MTTDMHIPQENDLWFLPLGGCGVFGANLNLYGHDGWWIMADAGTAFNEDRHLGIDMMIPDIDFIEARKDKLAAIVITHAHEDHIGALPYIWPRLRCPVFATPFAAEVIKRKCSEFDDCKDIVIKPLPTQSAITIQGFKITAIPVAHSIVEPRALHIETSAGNVMHTGDWNMDPTPVIGHQTSKENFGNLGPIRAVVGDSTNAPVAGRSGTESAVEPAFDEIFAGAKGKIAITMFSSNIGRIEAIAKAAQKVGRHVAVVGRSLDNMVKSARTCGYLHDCPQFLSAHDASDIAGKKMVYIIAGSQGEPRASLTRIAKNEHHLITLGQGDLVCYSARAIPGNDKKINEVMNHLTSRGVKILTSDEAPIHVSGHCYADDIKEFLSWVKPEILMAVHGELIHQEAHAELGLQSGVKHAMVPHNGQLWALREDGAHLLDEVEHGYQYIEEARLLYPDHAAINERKKLGFNGALFITVQGKEALVTALGLIDDEDEDDKSLMDDLGAMLVQMIMVHKGNESQLAEKLRTSARRFIDKELGYKPITIIHMAN